jgi:hypothetical protein
MQSQFLHITIKEIRLLQEIFNSEYQDGERVGHHIWLDYVVDSKSRGGVLASLITKKLVDVNFVAPENSDHWKDHKITDSTVALTQAAVDALTHIKEQGEAAAAERAAEKRTPKKCKEVDRALLQLVLAEMDEALAAIGERHGISLKSGSCSFTPETATFKVQLAILGEGGQAVDPRFPALKTYASSEGLRAEHLEPSFRFMHRGQEFALVGYNARAARMPFIVQRSDGNKFKFSRELLVGPLKLKPHAY